MGEEDESILLTSVFPRVHDPMFAVPSSSAGASGQMMPFWKFRSSVVRGLCFVLGCLLIGLLLQATSHLTFLQMGTVGEYLGFIRVLLILLQCAQITETCPHLPVITFLPKPFPVGSVGDGP